MADTLIRREDGQRYTEVRWLGKEGDGDWSWPAGEAGGGKEIWLPRILEET